MRKNVDRQNEWIFNVIDEGNQKTKENNIFGLSLFKFINFVRGLRYSIKRIDKVSWGSVLIKFC